MKCIFPILPIVILAGMGEMAWGQVGFLQRSDPGRPPQPTAKSPTSASAEPSRSTRAPDPVLARAAATPTPPRPLATSADRAREMLDRAIAAQQNWRSVAARVRTEIHLFDQRLVGSGTYVQGSAQERSWRLDLRIQTDHGNSTLLQVCDGKQFWTYREMGDDKQLEWVDAPRIFASLAKYRPLRGAPNASAGAMPTLGLGVGGLPRLLRSLDDCFEFRAANEGMLERMPVWILQGTWRPAILGDLLPDQKGAIEQGRGADLHKLAAHIPDRVTLYLGRDDLFPYRLEYHRDHPGEKEWEKLARESRPPATVKLEWFEVRFNVPLARDQFYYNPGETEFDDVTGRYLEGLGLPLD
jgi:hypothetical protein